MKDTHKAILKVLTPVLLVAILVVTAWIGGVQGDILGAVGPGQAEYRAMAWGDYYKSVQEQLAMLIAGTEEDGTAIPDRPFTLDGEAVDVTTSVDFTVTLDSEVVAVDATGQGDVPISTSRDLTVTLDSETVTVDTELAAAAALADAAANPTVPKVGAAELLYNDTTWDRERNNTEGTLLASAAYTTTTSSADTINYNSSALALFVDVTSITASPSVTAQLDWKDPVSGDYEPIWIATVAIVGTGEYIYLFDLGGLGSAGEYDEAVNIRIPRTFRLTMTHADADSITYSVGLALMQ